MTRNSRRTLWSTYMALATYGSFSFPRIYLLQISPDDFTCNPARPSVLLHGLVYSAFRGSSGTRVVFAPIQTGSGTHAGGRGSPGCGERAPEDGGPIGGIWMLGRVIYMRRSATEAGNGLPGIG